jgi:hypothetical protein
VRLFGSVTEDIEEHFEKEWLPIDKTLEGIVTEVNELQ